MSHAWSSFATMLLRILTPLVALITVLPATASAVGLEVNGRVAYGSAGGESPIAYEPAGFVRLANPGPIFGKTAAPYGGGLLLQGGIGLRTGKFVSVGLGGGIRNASATSPDPQITDLTRSAWNVGPWVRVYLPFVPIVEPYVGLGVEYVNDRQTYKGPFANPNGGAVAGVDHTLEHHGIGVPLTLGVDYTIAKIFSIGPSFQYTLVFPAGGCSKYNAANFASTSSCASDGDSKRFAAAKGYGVWSLGLSLRFTFPPV